MGSVCAWCRAVLAHGSARDVPVSHAVCPECRSELERALARRGLRMTAPSAGRQALAS